MPREEKGKRKEEKESTNIPKQRQSARVSHAPTYTSSIQDISSLSFNSEKRITATF
jgi:hypothetical protein